MIFGFAPRVVKAIKLPDGEYDAMWDYNRVTIQQPNNSYVLLNTNQISLKRVHCQVIVTEGDIEIKTKGIEWQDD